MGLWDYGIMALGFHLFVQSGIKECLAIKRAK